MNLEHYDRNINGLRTVKPYLHTFTTSVKQRWLNRFIYDIFVEEFVGKSKEYYKKAISSGLIYVETKNKQKHLVSLKYKVQMVDKIVHLVHLHEPPVKYLHTEELVIYDDDNILAVNKPASVPVHPCGGYRKNSLTTILKLEKNVTVHPVHRLDRLTSGIVIFAKNKETARKVMKLLTETKDKVKKEYLVRVHGNFAGCYEKNLGLNQKYSFVENAQKKQNGKKEYFDALEIKQPGIYKEKSRLTFSWPLFNYSIKHGIWKCYEFEKNVSFEAKPKGSMSRFTFLSYDAESDESLVLAEPLTGRTHQLRVHLQFLGFPVVNDPNYGKDGNVSQREMNKKRKLRSENVEDVLAEVFPQEDVETKATKLCIACQEKSSAGFSDLQLRYKGIDLHALRYTLKLDNKEYKLTTPLPEFARGFNLNCTDINH
eukprot:snap_masked-scaffold_53-processed-gene-0.33-mRNA-1 protein AED:0.59 eAED:0.59 QI:0/-1/0/1/-1/1/1/0/426